MESLVPQLGVAGILIYLLIKEMFSFLKTRNGNGSTIRRMDKLEIMADQIKDLHEWHNQADEDGVKVWYVRRSLEEAVEKLAVAITAQTSVMQALASRLDNLQTEVQRLEDKVEYSAKSK